MLDTSIRLPYGVGAGVEIDAFPNYGVEGMLGTSQTSTRLLPFRPSTAVQNLSCMAPRRGRTEAEDQLLIEKN